MNTNTTWQPGQSGNPKGRPPKGESLTELLMAYLEKKPEGTNSTYKQLFVEKLVNMAVVKGNLGAMKLIINYVDHEYLANINISIQDYGQDHQGQPLSILSALHEANDTQM
jgi:hypothetical protein